MCFFLGGSIDWHKNSAPTDLEQAITAALSDLLEKFICTSRFFQKFCPHGGVFDQKYLKNG